MKKLMIAAAIVCAAVMAQAGAVSWSMTNIKNASGNAITTGYVYTFSTADSPSDYNTQAKMISALGKATTAETFLAVLTAAGYDSALSGTITTSGTFQSGDVDVGDLTKFKPGSTKMFSVIVDSADGSINANTKWVVTSAMSVPKTIPTVESKTTQPFSINASTSTAGANWKSIPEPTSGLLMLLGVAGLALRRRRA